MMHAPGASPDSAGLVVNEAPGSRAVLNRQVLLLGADSAGWRLRAELPAIGTRFGLLVSASAAEAGLLARLKSEALAGIEIVAEVVGVGAGAPLVGVRAIARELEGVEIDGLVALGGGSVIDTAKATTLALHSKADLAELVQSAPPPIPPDPPSIRVIAIPTTLSGAEATSNAGVTDERGAKRVIRGWNLAPRIVASDPAVLERSPAQLIANTAMMALAHCLESLYAPAANPLSIAAALYGAELMGRGLPAVTSDKSAGGVEAFSDVGAGGVMAGLAISNARSGLQHAVCHVLGSGRYGMSQAQAHAVMLPSVMRFNEPATLDAQRRLVLALGGSATIEPAAFIEGLRQTAGADAHLRAFAVRRSDLAEIAATSADEPGARANPREADGASIKRVLDAAW
jgi:alcohol dehydrogenase class IV